MTKGHIASSARTEGRGGGGGWVGVRSPLQISFLLARLSKRWRNVQSRWQRLWGSGSVCTGGICACFTTPILEAFVFRVLLNRAMSSTLLDSVVPSAHLRIARAQEQSCSR